MSKRISFKVEGKVQGVFFRDFTSKQAKSAGITGFVRNASDGTVVGEAQGDGDALKGFLEQIGKGPSGAKVSSVNHEDIDAKGGEQSFSVTN